ncbi:hypothetical protein C1645_828100 [Glomus cerebriforme]|uniref:F-box domain-containing protein n=1 Tax=Glomus cerebriforme TaxID=658196 RepID=A0A397SQM6_9GLOM|nr:hypothetical protein C1645_828100 [Glomus cerebriforme]
MSQLNIDCLNEIFEYLKEEIITLRSCLLVNRLWSKTSVRILWRDVQNYSTFNFRTLISCLPNESKEILHENGIIISTPTLKPPLFNYASFCQEISVDCNIKKFLKNQQSTQYISSQCLNDNVFILIQEIYKLFMSQITSLKKLYFKLELPDVIFTSYPGAKDCLKDLSELHCHSDISNEFFYQLSQISHNIQTLIIEFDDDISNGLVELISVQQNLKHLDITSFNYINMDLILKKLPNTLVKISLYGEYYISLSFISKLINLRELRLSSHHKENSYDFEELRYINLPQLQILIIPNIFTRCELLIKFFENNGNNLKELNISGNSNNSLNSTIAKFCTNLRKLSIGFKNYKLETLKIVFNNCQYLESLEILCGGEYLSEKEVLEAVVKYSHKNFYELILNHFFYVQSELLPEELESFLIIWKYRNPQKSISLIIITDNCIYNSLDKNDENIKIIEKYIKLDVIKIFKIKSFGDDDYN